MLGYGNWLNQQEIGFTHVTTFQLTFLGVATI
jgi:hypothetical protein